jgi:hypothetical protein
VLHKLDFLTVVAVRDLSTSYSLQLQDGTEAASGPVPAAVLQHDMQLLVAPERPGLYLEMAQQLARWGCTKGVLLCYVTCVWCRVWVAGAAMLLQHFTA